MVSRVIKLTGEHGIHLRPAGDMCKRAQEYQCSINIKKETKIYNVKSIISILSACARTGDEIEIICEGEDEDKALEAMLECLESV